LVHSDIPGSTQEKNQDRLAHSLLQAGHAILTVNSFSSTPCSDQFTNFFSTYNRTLIQERVRDLTAICAAAPSLDPRKTIPFRVTLVGSGSAGLWSLMAAPVADAVIADCCNLDLSDETTLLAPECFAPGLLALGGFESAALLAAPHPVLLHNTGGKWSTPMLSTTYQKLGSEKRLRLENARLPDEEILRWITQ